ncbi:spermidine synthase [Daldinia bambusicola]|nr:spermidine synthase [Daldinia bambusicola]
MWPGQAMTLKVKKVLHHEKSKYQDVLIFESTDYGTVLVLDNVIQCTERDEFSYQEMITHLAMNSHPDPKKVLVIGGGDGGVLREVVKHECLEEAVLCDIDEAVIRLSKQYLPGMAEGFKHPKVKVHVGDGFKFLNDYKNAFDVIITDSSDPEGPAESLFQKSYFELLHGALRPGGVITTQGCTSPLYQAKQKQKFESVAIGSNGTELLKVAWLFLNNPNFSYKQKGRPWLGSAAAATATAELFSFEISSSASPHPLLLFSRNIPSYFSSSAENQWLHLPLITKLKKDCNEVFPVAEYAYTTIPTYPSGQIGFMVCCKEAGRDVKKPLRSWSPEEEARLCKYYNAEIHKASFILPTFAAKALQ